MVWLFSVVEQSSIVEILQFSEVKIDRLLKLSEIALVAIQFGSCCLVKLLLAVLLSQLTKMAMQSKFG